MYKNRDFNMLGSMLRNGGLVAVSVLLTLAAIQLFPDILLPISSTLSADQNPTAEQNSGIALTTNSLPIPDISDNFVAAAIERVGPAVVRIDTERTVETSIPNSPFSDPFFRQFFGDGFAPGFPQGEYRQAGQGSGFIVDDDGLILTNAHVVSGAEKVIVTLRDGRTFEGVVKGTDEPSDLAVIKIDGKDLPVAPTGDSSQLQVGDWAIAVGNPLGLDNTVTLGIISTLSRSSSQVGISDKRLDFIQTDVAINPGNSGGPLLNAKGEVIGINTAIRADAQGIGFAIPWNKAKEIQPVLARGETVPHPFIGIQMVTLTPEKAQQINEDPNAVFVVPETEGVLVMQVAPDSPAAEGGIRRGDLITVIDGDEVTSAEQLQTIVEGSKIGKVLQIEVVRNGKTERLKVRPAELQDMRQ